MLAKHYCAHLLFALKAALWNQSPWPLIHLHTWNFIFGSSRSSANGILKGTFHLESLRMYKEIVLNNRQQRSEPPPSSENISMRTFFCGNWKSTSHDHCALHSVLVGGPSFFFWWIYFCSCWIFNAFLLKRYSMKTVNYMTISSAYNLHLIFCQCRGFNHYFSIEIHSKLL